MVAAATDGAGAVEGLGSSFFRTCSDKTFTFSSLPTLYFALMTIVDLLAHWGHRVNTSNTSPRSHFPCNAAPKIRLQSLETDSALAQQ
jgi:hypothetical protein